MKNDIQINDEDRENISNNNNRSMCSLRAAAPFNRKVKI